MMFSLGLLSICVTGQYLFTGKVSYSNKKFFLFTILVGNFIGSAGFGWIIRHLRPDFVEKASNLCLKKISEGFTVIPLGILCNILIYFAVEGFKKGYVILLIFCVMGFILCGFEHCIANMFYFSVAGIFDFGYILLNIIGNAIGGILVFKLRKQVGKDE